MKKMERDSYQAYLLRIWRDSEKGPWRAMLENTHTGSRHNFADVEQLVSFLLAKMDGSRDL